MIKQSTIYILGAILLNYILSIGISMVSIGISMVFYGAGMPSFSVLSLLPILFTLFLGLILGETISFEKKSKTFCYIFSFLFFFGTSFFISLGVLIFDNWKESLTFEIETLRYAFFLMSGIFSVGDVLAAILLGYLLSTFNQGKKFKIEDISSEMKPETLLSAENISKKMISSEENTPKSINTEEISSEVKPETLLSAENTSKNMISSEENPLQSIKIEENTPSTEIKIPLFLLYKAFSIQFILPFVLFWLFKILFNRVTYYRYMEDMPFVIIFLISIYTMGYFVHKNIRLKAKNKSMCIWFGIFFMFITLHLSYTISLIAYSIFYNLEIMGILILNLSILFYFGIQTLCIGIWLGYQINKLRQ